MGRGQGIPGHVVSPPLRVGVYNLSAVPSNRVRFMEPIFVDAAHLTFVLHGGCEV